MFIVNETKKLKEKITKQNIAELRKEAQLYNKAIQKINTPIDLYQVAKSMQEYSIKLHKYFENSVCGRMSDRGWKDGHDNDFDFYAFKEFTHYLRDALDPYKLTKSRNYFNEWETYNERIWTSSYEYFNKRRSSIYTMFSQKLKKGFDNLEVWLETFPNNSAPDKGKVSFISYKGFKIQVTTDETHEDFLKTLKYSVETFKKDLDKLVRDLNRKRIDTTFLRKAYFEYNETISLGTGGDYREAGNIISVIPSSSNPYETLVHEVGHCYEATALNSLAQKEWQDFYKNPKNFVYITDEIKEKVKTELYSVCSEPSIKKFYDEVSSKDYYQKSNLQNMIKISLLKKFHKDSSEYKVSSAMLNGRHSMEEFLPSNLKDKDSIEREIKFFINLMSDAESSGGMLYKDRVMLNNMSLYSSKNEKEAFAEMFTYYVLDLYKKQDFSVEFIQFFKSIINAE
jgi:hypothetical protein